jgi:hypothetical protein
VASTVVLLRALQERRLIETERGRVAVGWLIAEDVAMVLALALLPAMAGLLNGNIDGAATAGGEPSGLRESPGGGTAMRPPTKTIKCLLAQAIRPSPATPEGFCGIRSRRTVPMEKLDETLLVIVRQKGFPPSR